MAIEGLVRSIADLEGQRAAAPGQIFSGITRGIQSGVKAVGEDLREAEWQKQLEKGMQGVLDMAQQVGLDENQLNMLKNGMKGKSGFDKDSINKFYVLVHNMKLAKDEKAAKEAAATAEKERFGRLVEPLRTAEEISTVALPGQTTEQAQFAQAKREAARGIESAKDIDALTKAAKLLGPEDPEAEGLTANQKRLKQQFFTNQEEKIVKRYFKDFDTIGNLNSTIDGLLDNNEINVGDGTFRKIEGLDPLSGILPAGAKTILAEAGLTEKEWTRQVNQNRRVIGQFMSEYIKSMSGLAVTEGEFKRLQDNLGAGKFTTTKEFENAFNQIIRTAKRKMEAKEKVDRRLTTKDLFNQMFPEGEKPSQQLRFLDLGVKEGKSKAAPKTTPKPKKDFKQIGKFKVRVKG